MLFQWLKNRRRRRWLAEREPNEWHAWLRKNLWQYRHLDGKQQRKVYEFAKILFHEKTWVGGGEFELTEEMRVTVGGNAALLTLGFEKPFYFDRLQTIILYPDAYYAEPKSTDGLLLGQTMTPNLGDGARLGEAWGSGPIVLSWRDVLEQGQRAKSRRNVVLHEFAHHMDGLDGETDGAPPLTDYKFEKKWYAVTQAEYQRLLELTRRGVATLLDGYGAKNQAEFFAVATECFFTQPQELYASHEELASVLERLFGQDPRSWLSN